MVKILIFKISRGEDGYYIAVNDEFGIYTQSKSFEDLVKNIREATEVSLEEIVGPEGDKSRLPPIMMNIDYSEIAYA